MDIELLINQIDQHNESSILATKKYKPKEVLFLYEKKEEEIMASLENYYKNNFSSIKLKKELINEDNIESIKKSINKNKDKNLLVNITGGRRINSLILLTFCIKNNIKGIYIDYKDKVLYEIEKEIKKINEDFEDLALDNILNSKGREIINDSTYLIENEDIKMITKAIYTNLILWHKYKDKLYDQKIFIHDYRDSKKIIINLEYLQNEEIFLLNNILKELRKLKGIIYFEKNKIIEVLFENEYLKSFIFKSGTWLEVITNILVREIDEIDEVKSGVIFLWDNKEKNVKNEIDVVLVKDSVITCISCKDSSKYNEDTLNELDIYANKIGGDRANKILVATKPPKKVSINQRAKEMNINIIIFDGDTEKFKNSIRAVIGEK